MLPLDPACDCCFVSLVAVGWCAFNNFLESNVAPPKDASKLLLSGGWFERFAQERVCNNRVDIVFVRWQLGCCLKEFPLEA